LYAGALRQFNTGLMGWSRLWILMSPLIEGAEGFMIVYLHRLSFLCLARIYCASDLGLEGIRAVCGYCVETVVLLGIYQSSFHIGGWGEQPMSYLCQLRFVFIFLVWSVNCILSLFAIRRFHFLKM
jgi:hypothetical protein